MPSLFKRKKKQNEPAQTTDLGTGSRLVTLNVGEASLADFVVEKRLVFDFVLVSFSPVENAVIQKIVLKDTIFWQKGHGSDQCNFVRCYTKNRSVLFVELVIKKGDHTTFEYFYKDYYKWVSTNPNKYSQVFSRQVDLFYCRATPKLNVNGNVNATFFYVNKLGDLPFVVITPKPGVWVYRVVDGIVDIWEKNYKSETCVNAVVFHRKGKPAYCYLLVNEVNAPKQSIYFKKDGVTWPRITKEEYVNAVKMDGFDPVSFTNLVTLDLSNAGDEFSVENFDAGEVLTERITPKTGYKVNKVCQGDTVVWTDNTTHLTYANVAHLEDKYSLLMLFLRGDRSTQLLYYVKMKGQTWTKVDKARFDFLTAVKDNPFNTHKHLSLDHKGDRKMLMSHFTNKQGLKIRTYCSTVENSKGNMVLVHGAFGHFCSDFVSYSPNFVLDYEHIFPVVNMENFDQVDCDTMNTEAYVYDTLTAHKDAFEYRTNDGLDLFDTGARYEYKRSFVEGLNNLGYNVYGLDLQSHGRSEAATTTRFYVKCYLDYVNDLLQFVDVLKRGKFYDSNQTYADYAKSKDTDFTDAKFYLVGYSMGCNIILRAINEHYKRTGSTKKFVDGLVLLSGMYQLAKLSNPLLQRLAALVISLLTLFAPKAPNPLEKPYDFTISHDYYNRFRDPMYAAKKSSNKMLLLIAKATFDLRKNLSFIPDDLPMLFMNSVDDDLVAIDGARKISKMIKNCKLVEVKGNVHGLPFSNYVTVVTPVLKEWLVGSL